MKAWSYSSLKKFKTCPRQYYEVRVAKNFKEPESTEATLYGKEFHKAAEEYVRDGVPLPPAFNYAKNQLDTLRNLEGEKFCEYEMGLTKDLEPCGFFDPQAWCRGVADLLVINREKGIARCVDYKTGKSMKYADTEQLQLMALMIFKHFPEVRKVKGGLLFVVANGFRKDDYDVADEHAYWRPWMQTVSRLETAHSSGVWNPNPSGLCKRHCVVATCPHNGSNK